LFCGVKGCTATLSLFIDGQKVGEGRVEITEPFAFSADETVDVGMEGGRRCRRTYGPCDNAFNGQVNWVEMDVDKEALDQDHFLIGEECFKVAMPRQ
jgi:hypothetical protein